MRKNRNTLQKPTVPVDLPGNVVPKVQSGTQHVKVQSGTQHARVRSRPSALVVEVKANDFPALARKIRGGVDPSAIGDSVMGMRDAKASSLLIEVRGGQTRLDAVTAEIARTAGLEVAVRTLQQRALLEIRDLDQWSSSVEVLEEVANATDTGAKTLKAVSLRKRFGGIQTALVSLSLEKVAESSRCWQITCGPGQLQEEAGRVENALLPLSSAWP